MHKSWYKKNLHTHNKWRKNEGDLLNSIFISNFKHYWIGRLKVNENEKKSMYNKMYFEKATDTPTYN